MLVLFLQIIIKRVFFGKRINKNVWQFPQGGLKNQESHVHGMFRELKEEIGLDRDDVIIIGKTTKWLCYGNPKKLYQRCFKL